MWVDLNIRPHKVVIWIVYDGVVGFNFNVQIDAL